MDTPVPVILREGEELGPIHEELIGRFLASSEWELRTIGSSGLTEEEIENILRELRDSAATIFASYDPLLLALFCRRTDQSIYLFHRARNGFLELCAV